MMEVVNILFCLFCSILLASALDLPPYVKKCKKSDPQLNDCILKTTTDFWQTFIQGDNKYHIRKMNPLFVSFMEVRVDENLYGNLTNGNMHGFEQAELKSLKMDLDKNTIDALVLFPISAITGNYELYGKLLGLQIEDAGTTNVTFVNGLNRFIVKYQLKEKKGKQYIEILSSVVNNEDMERIYFDTKLTRNAKLGDTLNDVLNKNWKEVSELVKNSVGEALGGITTGILQPVFDKVPFDNFFAAE